VLRPPLQMQDGSNMKIPEGIEIII